MSGFCADALPVSTANAAATNKSLLHPNCVSLFGAAGINHLPYTDGAVPISRIYPIGATSSNRPGRREAAGALMIGHGFGGSASAFLSWEKNLVPGGVGTGVELVHVR